MNVLVNYANGTQLVTCAPGGMSCPVARANQSRATWNTVAQQCPCCGTKGDHHIGPDLPVPACLQEPS